MKNFIIIFFCLTSIISWGLPEIKTKTEPKVISNQVLEKRMDSLLKIQTEYKDLIYEKRIQQASETIANQNAMISSFSTLYSVITIILALIGISLPILTYQFGIKPSQKALKEFQENADAQIEKFLVVNRDRQIDKAIENIQSKSLELKNNALNFLSLTTHEGFTNSQIDKMIILLYSNDIDEKTKSSIAFSIMTKKHPSSTNYFRKVFEENLKDQFYSAFTYFKNTDSFEYFDLIKNLLAKSPKQYDDFNLLSIYLSQQSQEDILKYLNNSPIIDILNDDTIKALKGSIETYRKHTWKIEKEEFEKTYLYKRLSASS